VEQGWIVNSPISATSAAGAPGEAASSARRKEFMLDAVKRVVSSFFAGLFRPRKGTGRIFLVSDLHFNHAQDHRLLQQAVQSRSPR